MINASEYFRSVADVWVVWLICVGLGGWMLSRSVARVRPGVWRRFFAGERGASYALSYVITFPFYLLLVCLVIQSTIVLLVKTGTVYAAYATARAAAVWSHVEPGTPEDKWQEAALQMAQPKAQRAAVLAMIPFASSDDKHLRLFLIPRNDLALRRTYVNAYLQLEGDSISQDTTNASKLPRFLRAAHRKAAHPDYLRAKIKYAFNATRVRLEFQPHDTSAGGYDLVATVDYRMPLHVPLAGAILRDGWQGYWMSPVYSRVITSEVRLPCELPQSADHSLGIDYDPRYE